MEVEPCATHLKKTRLHRSSFLDTAPQDCTTGMLCADEAVEHMCVAPHRIQTPCVPSTFEYRSRQVNGRQIATHVDEHIKFDIISNKAYLTNDVLYKNKRKTYHNIDPRRARRATHGRHGHNSHPRSCTTAGASAFPRRECLACPRASCSPETGKWTRQRPACSGTCRAERPTFERDSRTHLTNISKGIK